MNGATPGPWAYRSQEGDDWGFIRTTVVNDAGWRPVVAIARYVGNPTDADLGEHRRNGTDPSFANAELIVRAVNSHEDLTASLRSAWAVLSIVLENGWVPAKHADPVRQSRDNAAAALAKARGETL